MAVVKKVPEDFVVKEQSNLDLKEHGSFAIFLLKKRQIGTEEAVGVLCRKLGLNRKQVGYAGLKDRQAVTEQYISIRRGAKRFAQDFGRFSLTFEGWADQPISLGDLKRNSFWITVRELSAKEVRCVEQKKRQLERQGFWLPNLFGEQRFSKNNHLVGKALVQKRFIEAVERLLDHAPEHGYEEKVAALMKQNQQDPIRALRALPLKTLTLFVNAYQSLLFNRVVWDLSPGSFENLKRVALPLVGYGTRFAPSRNRSKQALLCRYQRLLEDEGMAVQDFVIRPMPEISSFGSERKVLMKVYSFMMKMVDDEPFRGKKKMVVRFALPKGSYATVMLDWLLDDTW